MAVNPFTHARH